MGVYTEVHYVLATRSNKHIYRALDSYVWTDTAWPNKAKTFPNRKKAYSYLSKLPLDEANRYEVAILSMSYQVIPEIHAWWDD